MTGRSGDYQEMFLHTSQPKPSPEVEGSQGRACSRTDPSTQGRCTHVLLGPQTIWQLSPSRWCQRPGTEEPEVTTAAQNTHRLSYSLTPGPGMAPVAENSQNVGAGALQANPLSGGGGHFMAVLLSEQHGDSTHMAELLPTTQPCTSVQL